jgi:ribonucleoside-diphosphate reductase alpha chain
MDYRCAMDLSCDEHLKILATMAKHIDSSQSKTINVASDYPYEDFKNIYINAYLTKRIKGVTTYRDKTKAAVLNTKSQSECECCKKIAKTTAPKRPKTLPCKVHLMTIKGIAYYAIVSMLGEDPYEVFIGQNKEDIKNEDGEYVGSKLLFFQKLNGCEGELTRLTRGKYTFKSKDGKIEVPIIRTEESEDTALITAFSRILSWGLRHGGDIKFAVDQLEKTEGSFSSATKVFSRVLKKYIKATDQVCGCDDKKTVCPKCGAALVFTEGCKHCAQCGWSACG